MEVVVIVHAGQITTSKARAYFDINTISKRKLITPETEHASNVHKRSCCGKPTPVNNNFKTVTALFTHGILLVDVTGNTLTTMCTQLQPDAYVMMMKL